MSGLLTRWLDWLEKTAKTIGALTVLLAALSQIPIIGTLVNFFTAWGLGIGMIGNVYYEIGDNRTLTRQGRLYLLRAGSGDFTSLGFGDKLQAQDEVNFHEKPDKDSAPIFLLRGGDCVVVIGKEKELKEFKDPTAKSGGWLKVATTACGLFR